LLSGNKNGWGENKMEPFCEAPGHQLTFGANLYRSTRRTQVAVQIFEENWKRNKREKKSDSHSRQKA